MIVRAACLSLVLAAGPVLAQTPDLPMEAPPDTPISIPGGDPREPDAPPGPPPEQLFISPAGEPFRAAPGEPYPTAAWFARADDDRDGQLTLAEFTADSLAFFDRLDVDKDQQVDGFESSDYERDIAPEITGVMPSRERAEGGGPPLSAPTRAEQMIGAPTFFRPRGKPMPPRRQGAAQYSLINEPHPVRGADANLDHRVSRVEAIAAAAMRFALLDADGDGRVALADLPGTPAQTMRQPRPEGGRRKARPKDIEMQLQPAAVNAIDVVAPAADSSRETP